MSGINLSSPVTPPNRMYAELPSPSKNINRNQSSYSRPKTTGPVVRLIRRVQIRRKELKKLREYQKIKLLRKLKNLRQI